MPTFDFSPYAAVLLDLDGTIYHEEHEIPGASDLIARLRREGRKYACLTNSTSSPARIRDRLNTMNIDIDAAHIYSAAAATADYVVERFGASGRRPRVFNLSTRGIHEMLEGKVEWVETTELMQRVACDVVICGAPANIFATAERQRVALHLLNCGAALLGICADRTFPTVTSVEFGCGALGSMLAYAAKVEPTYCGKPQPLFFRELCGRLGVAPERCILIGDNLESDIKGAKGVGMTTALVLSGVTKREHLAAVKEENRPEFVFESVKGLA
jgi:4-nitrophenyl phosphatase